MFHWAITSRTGRPWWQPKSCRRTACSEDYVVTLNDVLGDFGCELVRGGHGVWLVVANGESVHARAHLVDG